MRSFLRVVSSALLASALLGAFQAEARFGKASPPSAPERQDPPETPRDSDTHDASPVDASPSRDEHAATPVRRPEPSRRPSRPPPPARARDEARGGASSYEEPFYEESSYEEPYDESPASTYVAAPLPEGTAYGATEEYRSRRSKNFLFGFDAQWLPEGSATGMHLGVEGEEVGALVRVSGLKLRAEEGGGGEDQISVVGVHLSWAALRSPSGRLRMEAGLSVASAPDVTFVGPSLGLSSELYLLDSLALEGRVHVTPVPYRQLDAAGGVVGYFLGNLVALRSGLRVLVLNDAGAVDGVVHQDVLPGPYVSVGLAL
jgi:hypothetical protein